MADFGGADTEAFRGEAREWLAANFPKERIPAKDEKPEDKDKADKAWKDRQKQLEDKVKQKAGAWPAENAACDSN